MNKIDFNTTKLTQALVKCKSVTPIDDGAIEIVQKHLSSIGFKCTPLLFTEPNSYDVKNLFASIGSSGRHLAFAGHTIGTATSSVDPLPAPVPSLYKNRLTFEVGLAESATLAVTLFVPVVIITLSVVQTAAVTAPDITVIAIVSLSFSYITTCDMTNNVLLYVVLDCHSCV